MYGLGSNFNPNAGIQTFKAAWKVRAIGITNPGTTWVELPQQEGSWRWVPPGTFNAIFPSPVEDGPIQIRTDTAPPGYTVNASGAQQGQITLYALDLLPSLGSSPGFGAAAAPAGQAPVTVNATIRLAKPVTAGDTTIYVEDPTCLAFFTAFALGEVGKQFTQTYVADDPVGNAIKIPAPGALDSYTVAGARIRTGPQVFPVSTAGGPQQSVTVVTASTLIYSRDLSVGDADTGTLPATYAALWIIMDPSASGGRTPPLLRFNSDAGANYDYTFFKVQYDGTTATTHAAGATSIECGEADTYPTAYEIIIPNYATVKNPKRQTVRGSHAMPDAFGRTFVYDWGGVWTPGTNTSVTSVQLVRNGVDAGMFRVYGLPAS